MQNITKDYAQTLFRFKMFAGKIQEFFILIDEFFNHLFEEHCYQS